MSGYLIKEVDLTSLETIYATLPKIKCKGACYDYCGIITPTKIEKEYVEKMTGKPADFGDLEKQIIHTIDDHPDDQDGCCTCPYLKDKRCSIYEARPLICRIWGLVMVTKPQMKCPFGCKVERWLSGKEANIILKRVIELSMVKA